MFDLYYCVRWLSVALITLALVKGIRWFLEPYFAYRNRGKTA